MIQLGIQLYHRDHRRVTISGSHRESLPLFDANVFASCSSGKLDDNLAIGFEGAGKREVHQAHIANTRVGLLCCCVGTEARS